jgi:putative FmdB family regulatory protein
MPTYQYRCAKCGEQFELWQSIHDNALKRHPGCGGKVTKVLSPAGIVLKGPGFYRTDSRASAGKSGDKREKADKSESTSSNGSGSGEGSKEGSKSTSSASAEKSPAKPSKKDSSST